MTMKRLKVGVLFGGRSVEHEISIISALQLMKAMDVKKYEPIPIYIDPKGQWYCGSRLFHKDTYLNLSKYKDDLCEVTLLPKPPARGLTVLARGDRFFQSNAHLKDHINRENLIPIDVFIPAFHGEFGEDGCVQGLLELADATYTGCSMLPSSVAMDKAACKALLKSHGIPVLPDVTVSKRAAQLNFNQVVQSIIDDESLGPFPYFIKPRHLGSSIGIGKANNQEELAQRIAKVFFHDNQAIIEPCLNDMFEINVSVRSGMPPEASVIEVPHASEGELTFEDKYLRGGKKKGQPQQSEGMESLPRSINPESVPDSMKQAVIQFAIDAYEILGADGIVRFDFMVDSTSNQIYFNELNPIPGSMAFYLWFESEPSVLYTNNISRLIRDAQARHAEKLSLEKTIAFRALKA